MKLVVFDMDGTLVDSQSHIVGAMTAGLASAGLPPLPHAKVLSIVGLSLPLAIATLLPDADAATLDQVQAGYRQHYLSARMAQASPLYSGVADMLDRLSDLQGLVMAVATGKSRRGMDAVLGGHGIAGLFVARECADGHPSKPHPAMLLAALDTAGVAPSDAVMIGDTTFDMDMARAAGVTGWGVSWGYHAADTLDAARLFNEVATLADALEAWA